MNTVVNDKEKLLKQYEDDANDILQKMYQVVMQAQRVVEDKQYREALQKLEREK